MSLIVKTDMNHNDSKEKHAGKSRKLKYVPRDKAISYSLSELEQEKQEKNKKSHAAAQAKYMERVKQENRDYMEGKIATLSKRAAKY